MNKSVSKKQCEADPFSSDMSMGVKKVLKVLLIIASWPPGRMRGVSIELNFKGSIE